MFQVNLFLACGTEDRNKLVSKCDTWYRNRFFLPFVAVIAKEGVYGSFHISLTSI